MEFQWPGTPWAHTPGAAHLAHPLCFTSEQAAQMHISPNPIVESWAARLTSVIAGAPYTEGITGVDGKVAKVI